MEIDKKIDELLNEIYFNNEILNKLRITYKNKEVKLYEYTILNFISRNSNNLNGVKLLLEHLKTETFLIVPISSIMRTISSDALTITYLLSFLSKNLDEVQTTFMNELNSLSLEHFQLLKEFSPEFKNPSFYKDNKIKTRTDFHTDSDKEIIREQDLSNSKFLTEKNKLLRINYSIDENIGVLNFSKSENANYKIKIKNCYEANKWFSQYYHYNSLNSELSTSKSKEIVEIDLEQISICIKDSFSLLTFYISLIKKVE